MMSPQSADLFINYGFISTSISLMTTTLGRMVDQYALILLWKFDDVTKIRSREKRLWLYLHFRKLFNK